MALPRLTSTFNQEDVPHMPTGQADRGEASADIPSSQVSTGLCQADRNKQVQPPVGFLSLGTDGVYSQITPCYGASCHGKKGNVLEVPIFSLMGIVTLVEKPHDRRAILSTVGHHKQTCAYPEYPITSVLSESVHGTYCFPQLSS